MKRSSVSSGGRERSAPGHRAAGVALPSFLLFAGLIASALPALATEPRQPATENVILVVIDGVRATEAFHHPDPGPPHPVIPRLWGELRPQGALCTHAVNDTYTKTGSTLNAILTGTWHLDPNLGVEDEDLGWRENRTLFPTILEAYRRSTGAAPNRTGYYTTKVNGRGAKDGWHPLYGEAFAPGTFVYLDPGEIPYHDGGVFIDDTNPDDLAYQHFVDWIAYSPERPPEDYPSLVVFHLGLTDDAGHHGDYGLYLDVIRNADDVVGDLWTTLSAHPHYAGKTTLIVMTDHGRHDPEHGDFRNHTGACEGCRTIFVLVLGPDTPAGIEVSRRVVPPDIGATIAHLLGVPFPHATGRTIHEVTGEDPPEGPDARITESSTACDGDTLYVTCRRTYGGRSDIAFTQTEVTASDIVFDEPFLLTSVSGSPDFRARHPSIGVVHGGSAVRVAWVEYDPSSWLWNGKITVSHDQGAGFTPARDFILGTMENSIGKGYTTPVYPLVLSEPGGAAVMASFCSGGRDDAILLYRSRDDFASPSTPEIFEPSAGRLAYFRQFDAVCDDFHSASGMVFVRSEYKAPGPEGPLANWEVFFRPIVAPQANTLGGRRVRAIGNTTLPGGLVRLTDTATPSIQPAIARDPSNPDRLLVAWAQPLTEGGPFQVHLRESLDRGATWGPGITLTTSALGAWEPDLRVDDAGVARLAYVDFDTGEGDIRTVTVDAAGVVSPPTTVAATPDESRHPHVEMTATQGPVVVWEEGWNDLRALKLP